MEQFKSTKILPYVYVCTHKLTQKFYIGYREKNVSLGLTSDQDLPLYKTSSKNVKPFFNEFEWKIIAEFETGDDAYDFEQFLIFENWGDPLLLNEHCHYKKRRHKSRKSMTDETKEKISNSKKGKPGLVGNKNPMYGKRGALNPMYGVPRSEETKKKISEHNKGQIRLAGDKNPMYGKKWSESHKNIVSEKLKNIAKLAGDNWVGSQKLRESAKQRFNDGTHPSQQETQCPHCLKIIKGRSNYFRWHGDNCRNKD